jgi:hypothetical protein
MSIFRLIPFVLFSICITFSSVAEEQNLKKKPQIYGEIAVIKELTPNNYIRDVHKFRKSIEKYIAKKKGVCNGDFSTIILDEKGEDGEKIKKKLSRSERKLCFSELKDLEISFINAIYLARKRYLEDVHTTQISDLAKAREEVIKKLKHSYSRRR